MREIVQSGGRAHGYCCNVAKHENVVELHEKVIVTILYFRNYWLELECFNQVFGVFEKPSIKID